MSTPVGFIRQATAEFEVTMTDWDGLQSFHAVQTEREIRMTLGIGETWPDVVRRGQSVDLEMNLGDWFYRLRGRVRFKRLNVAVIHGRMERAA